MDPLPNHMKLKKPKACEFCGSSGPMSDEHLWGKWMVESNFIPVSGLKSYIVLATAGDSPFGGEPAYSLRRQSGPPTSRRHPVVCRDCNSGWMSQLEEQVKPFLGPMMQGIETRLDERAQKLLARWIDKTIMIYEFESPDAMTTSPWQREQFVERDAPSEPTHVFIGRYSGVFDYPQILHSSGKVSDIPGTEILRRGTDIATVGQVLFYVTRATDPLLQFDDYPATALTDHLKQIWPIRDQTVSWLPSKSINRIQHYWLEGWKNVDAMSEHPNYPVEFQKTKISPRLWAELRDEDNITTEQIGDHAPIEPGWDALRKTTHRRTGQD